MLKKVMLKRVLIGLLMLTGNLVCASITTYSAPRIYTVPGTPVVTGVNSTAEITPPYTGGSFTNISVNNRITFAVDHFNTNYVAAAGNITINLQVETWNSAGGYATFNQAMTIKYQPFNPASPYEDKAVYTFSNAYKVKITLLTINGVAPATLQSNLYIDNDIQLERIYSFTGTAPTVNAHTTKDYDCNAVVDAIEINWATLTGAEEYQVEWTFVNDYSTALGSYLASSAIQYDFKNNSTRVSTSNTTYPLTLTFEHGYIVYRVRGIGRDMSNPSKNIVGNWSISVDSANVSTISSAKYLVTDHEADKNWQYVSTFAQEGKKKEVITYYDGSLRNRQSVTKINSDNNTIVGESIYDHQGRPAVNVLPVPVPAACSTGTAIKFYPAFNKVDASNAYTRVNFDLDKSGTDTCSPVTTGMHVSSGASNYYSASNPNRAGVQAFVPDAELFPFSQVEYTRDNTGRIRRQGGVGKEFQLDKKHTTNFFYGRPQQVQLDRLFGSEVGDAAHYKKNMVVDPNGQVSINYLDQEGRTVATSLAGNAPKDATGTITILDPLPSYPVTAQTLNVDMFAKDANGKSMVNTVNVTNDGIEFVSQLTVAYQSDYEFTYDLEIDKFNDPCLKEDVCFNCVYDLEIKITDDCGRTIAPTSGTHPVSKKVGRFLVDGGGQFLSFFLECTTPSLYNLTQNFTVYLPIGNYTVVKKLTVNKDARDFYVDAYFERVLTPTESYTNLEEGCIMTFQDFLDEALAAIDTNDCNISCSTCVASLQGSYGTLEEARDGWVAAGKGTEMDFDYLLEECNEPCTELSVCQTNYEMMLMDVSPDGQYGEFQTKANGDPPDLNVSVFNSANLLPRNTTPGSAYWKKPNITISGNEYYVYIDENGVRTRIPVALTGAACPPSSGAYCTPNVDDCTKVYYDATTATYYTYAENLASLSDFIANWNDNWAKSLVKYHPEYEYYVSCLAYTVKPSGYLMSSDAFDNLLLATKTYADAATAGLVVTASATPLAPASMILFNQSGSSVKDPFLFDASMSGAHITTLNNKMATYQTGYAYSMAAAAALTARCGTTFGGATGATCDDFGSTAMGTATLDEEWNLFKNMYLAEKQKAQKTRDDERSVQAGVYGYNGCIGNSAFNPFHTPMVPYITSGTAFWATPVFNINHPCSWPRAFFYRNKKKRFYPQSNLAPVTENYTDRQIYLQTGQCPLVLDIQFLLNTLAANVKLTATAGSGENIQVYPEFARDLYLALGGTTGTASTFYWKATTTTDVMNANISNGTSTCNFTLNKTGTGIASWNDVLGITNVKYTTSGGGIYNFSALATVSDGSGGYNYKPITGSTCINISSCSFADECEPNDLAVDLANLWTALKTQGVFQSTTAVVLLPNYALLITPAIKNALLTTSNNLLWKYDGTSKYDLYDAATPSKKLQMQFTAGSLTGVYGFINIKGGGTNVFTVEGVTSATAVNSLTGNMNLINGGTTSVSMGKCGPPEDILCQGDEYQLRDDLEKLLKDIMLRNPFDYDPDLTASTAYTTLLASYVGTSSQVSTTKYDNFVLNTAGDYKEQLLFNILCKCKLLLWHKSKATPALKFEDLVNLGTLKPYGPVASDNNQYQFYMVGTYFLGGSEYTDTIFGESCFPIKTCTPTISTDTTFSPEVDYVNPCILQLLNLAHVNAENNYNNYINNLTTTLSDNYTKHCLSALENLNAEYDDKEHHFTLYYYDQAGNLIKTIPPEGVELVTSPSDFTQIVADRTNNTRNFFTNHRMATTYIYNSLNQLVKQSMPDHDMMDIWEFTLPNGLDSRLRVTSTQFVNSTKGYLTGYVDIAGLKRGYLYSSNDGGATWNKMNDLVAADLKKVQMVSTTVGYSVGKYGTVMKTNDGGNTWDMLSTGILTTLNDLYFINANTGIVVGENSVALRTIDGGATWLTAASGIAASHDITSVTYDTTALYITANDAVSGKIYVSTVTGGVISGVWTQQTSIQNTDIVKLQFTTSTEGFAIAADGNLIKTTNAGVSWVAVPTGVANPFRDFYFKVPSSGPALEGVAIIDSVANKGLIWKTIDGGITWTQLSTNDGCYYNTFHFYQNDKGYAVGSFKMKRVAMTGGIGLVNIPLPLPAVKDMTNLTAVHFYNANEGWVANATRTYYTNNLTASAPIWTNGPSTGFAVKELYFNFNPSEKTGLLLTTAGTMYKITWSGSAYVLTSITTTENYADLHENATRVYAFNKTAGGSNVKYVNKTGSLGTATSMTAATGASHPSPSTVTCIALQTNEIYTGGTSGLLVRGGTLSTSIVWTTYTNTNTPMKLYDIQSAGGGNLYAVGQEGTLLQTLNSGTLWKVLPTGSVTQYNAMKFNKRHTTAYAACAALIAGNGGQLTKADLTLAGVVTLSNVPLTTALNLNDVAVHPSNRAYVAGASGTVISIPTIVTPVPAPAVPQPSPAFNGVCFKPGTNMAIAVGNNAIIYNYNGTSGAKLLGVYPSALTDASFIDVMNGYVIGENNTIRYTTNGGLRWSYVPRSGSVLQMNAIATYATNKAVIVGNTGYKGEVTDSTVVNGTLGAVNLNDIEMVPGKTGYIVGASSAYKQSTATYSGTWTSLSSTPVVTFRTVHIFRDNSMAAAGDANTLYCHNGTAWSDFPFGGTTLVKDIFFHDDRNGYAVGDAGVIYRCSLPQNIWTYSGTNSGLWTAKTISGINGVSTPANVNITVVTFPDRYNGFLGGYFNTGTPVNYARLLRDESMTISGRFWYDRLGRMVVSQNTKQFNRAASQSGKNDYTYTRYDELGRIIEVGELTEATAGAFQGIFGDYINGTFNPNMIKDASFASWVSAATRREVTRTYYDKSIPGSSFGFTQNNLRRRVSSVTFEDNGDGSDLTYQSATHYSYDIHGNVNTVWQENTQVPASAQRVKRVDYEYDLISGKANVVRYQDGQPDAFYHYYEYDADNRITDVYTSAYPHSGMKINNRSVLNNSLWSRDARYIYYAHGPLARLEEGDGQVQGIDYAYTLQGLLKGTNSNLLSAVNDMGNDGHTTGSHTKTAKDAFSYTLSYYAGDYAAIDRWTTTGTRFESVTASSDLMGARYDLHNGDVTAMVTTIEQPRTYTSAANEFPTILPQGMAYEYDQLHRLRNAEAYNNLTVGTNTWASGSTYAGRYLNTFSYDANGNILGQKRNDESGTTIDSLTYKYNRYVTGGYLKQNRLYNVNESVSAGAFTDDIDNMTPGWNYSFDEIGNLKEDKQEQILKIEWTVSGKIKKVVRTSASIKSDLEFKYDPAGNRIAKIEKPDGSSLENGGTDNPSLWTTTYYVRNAQGNVMGTYKLTGSTGSHKIIERPMYGTNRLGTNNNELEMISPPALANPYMRTLGLKNFEGSNHLGNVIAVYTDKKIPRDDNADGTIDYYQPELVAANDYNAFGSAMGGRTFSSNKYRYGFNDKEKYDEIKGNGNSYDYGARIYDPRIGRWLAIDPSAASYANKTPYGFASQNPVNRIDPDGQDDYHFYTYTRSATVKIGNGETLHLNLGTYQWYTVTETNTKNTYTTHHVSYNEGGQNNYSEAVVTGADAGNVIIQFGLNKGSIRDGSTLAPFRKTEYSDYGDIENLARLAKRKNFENKVNAVMFGLLLATVSEGLLAETALGMELAAPARVNLMGGPTNKVAGFINYDRAAIVGIKDEVANFGMHFGNNSVGEMVVNNPMAPFIEEVTPSMISGGQITIRGNMKNPNFSSLWDAAEIPGYEIIKKTKGVSAEGFVKTSGEAISGTMNEIILIKK